MSTPAVVGTTPGVFGGTAARGYITVTATSAVPAGHHLVLLVAHSSQTAATTMTVAGTAGNVWTRAGGLEGLAPVTRGIEVWDAPITSPLTVGSTVTATLAAGLSGERLAAALVELDQTCAVDAVGVSASLATSTTPTATVTTTGAALVLSAVCAPNTPTVTPAATFTAGPGVVSTVGTTDVQVASEYKQVASAGAQVAGFTLSQTAVAAVVAVAYKPAGVPIPPYEYQAVSGVWVPCPVYQSSGSSWI